MAVFSVACRSLFLTALASVVFSGTAWAGKEEKPMAPVQTVSASADSSVERVKVSEDIHKVRPFKRYVDQAIQQVMQRIDERNRAKAIAQLQDVIDYDQMERASIKAMAETFSLKELQAMLAFYGSEEGKAAERKMPDYQAAVVPELRRVIDAALMDIRMGKTTKKTAE